MPQDGRRFNVRRRRAGGVYMGEAVETIGKVRLDYSRYPGRDLYCDGAVEDELLDIVRRRQASEYQSVIEESGSWPILYHLSPLRENIIDWIPLSIGGKRAGEDGHRRAKVLEVGSGCGALTGALSRKAQSVTCVELSKKRSQINAYRHRNQDNITIHVGNFKDIEPDLPKDFDFIFLIGVFEYAQGYVGGSEPYETFLKQLLPHLAAGGRLVIAIENKYGLKYFAGCKEDHLGTYFSGIENYGAGGQVRTFGRNGLERIFRSCGVEEYHFYYPYPDYKFMTMLYSDEYLPGKGELSNNLRNFDRDRMLLFDEKSAFDGMGEEGLFPLFSNSYLAVIGRDFDVKYVKYSNDRLPEYAIRTEIARSRFGGSSRFMSYRGGAVVRKYPMGEAAQEHIRGMAAACESLKERYEGSGLEINDCSLAEDEDGILAEFPFVQGVPLSELMDGCLERNDLDGFYGYFRRYVERVGYRSEYPAADFDLIFSNILVEQIPGDEEGKPPEEKWTLIDYEWTFGKPMDTKELAFRAVHCYLLEDGKRSRLDLNRVCKELSVTQEEAESFREQERDFQSFVTGGKSAMASLREKIGGRVMVPQKWIDKYQDSGQVNQVQIYEDRGDGFREENSYFVKDAYEGENRIDLELQVGSDVERLRIDPGMFHCVVKIMEMTLNGTAVPLEKRKILAANGRILRSGEKGMEYCPSIVFATDDPNISIWLAGLGRTPEGRGRTPENLKLGEKDTLRVRMDIVRLSPAMAKDLAEGKEKRRF